MQKTIIIGRVGKDATTKTLDSGSTAISFSVAVTEKIKKGGEWTEETTWYNCTKWVGPTGSTKVAEYIKKGGIVAMHGKLSARVYEGKAYLELRVDELELHGGKPSGESNSNGQSEPENLNSIPDDEMPF